LASAEIALRSSQLQVTYSSAGSTSFTCVVTKSGLSFFIHCGIIVRLADFMVYSFTKHSKETVNSR